MSDSRKNQVSKIKTNSDSDNNTFKRQIDKETAEKIDKSVEYEGDCSWYNESKGYGFITCSALPCDAWVHISNINSNDTADPANAKLHTGQHCAFQVQLKPCPGAEDSFRVSAVNVFPVLKDGSEEPPKSAKRLSGVCVRFNEHKKFGFVQCAEKGCERLFVHKDQIQGGKPLREGQKVTLELATFKGRTKAVNVIAEKFVEDPLSKDVRKGVVAIFYDDRAFGFVREEDCGETHFFHKENVIGRKDLVEFQEVKFKLRKKIGLKKTEKVEAFDIVPGIVREKEIYKGIIKVAKQKERFGIINRKDSSGSIKKYIFDFDDLVKSDDGALPTFKEGDPCTFTPKLDRKNQFRAVYVSPQNKKTAEDDYLGFEPYLPSHFEAIKKIKAKKKEKNKSNNGSEIFENVLKHGKTSKKKNRKRKNKKKIQSKNSQESTEIKENGQKSTEMKENGQKSTKIKENGQKSTKIKENGQKSTKIKENGQKSTKIKENGQKSTKIKENGQKSTKIKENGQKSTEMDKKKLNKKIKRQNKKTKFYKSKNYLNSEISSDKVSMKERERGLLKTLYLWIISLCKKY